MHAVNCMLEPCTIPLFLRHHLPALFTKTEPLAGHLVSGDFNLIPVKEILLAKVDLAEYGFPDKLKTKGKRFVLNAIGLLDERRIHFRQHVLVIEDRFPVIGIVMASAVAIRLCGHHLLHLDQSTHHRRIGPSTASTLGTGRLLLNLNLHLRVRAFAAEAPGFLFGNAQIHLINHQLSAIHIESISGSQFLNGRPGRTLILMRPRIILAFPVLFDLLAIDNRAERYPGFRECIIGKKPLIREKIKGMFFVQTSHQPIER